MVFNYFKKSAIHAKRDVNIVSNSVTHNYYGPEISLAPKPDPMSILRERVAFSALPDSAEYFDPPKCHPETRTAVLDLVDRWAKDRSESAQPVFWLTGAAGAGKSAIAYTLVERWKKEGLAVLSFFFWRTSAERNHKTKLVPTLSYQLSKHYPSAQVAIEGTAGSGDILTKNLQTQIEELLLRPLENVPTDQSPTIVVIDGLDECCMDIPRTPDFAGQDFRSQQREILNAVGNACLNFQTRTPRFLIASRPEQTIRESFARPRLQGITHQLSLNDAPNVKEDILLFLRCGFEEIRRTYPSLPLAWPGQDRLSELVKRSCGQFIYASIVVKHITHRRQYPEKSLQDVLDLRTQSKNRKHHPFVNLDSLYALILESVSDESLDIVRMILGILCYFENDWAGRYVDHGSPWYTRSIFNPLQGDRREAQSPHFLDKLLFLSCGEVVAHLSDLHSILHIPPAGKPHDTLRILHSTLLEYLQDESRSKHLHIAPAAILPNLCLITLRHLTAGKQEVQDYKTTTVPFEEAGMYYYGLLSLSKSVKMELYSEQVKDILWSFLKDEIGGYSSIAIEANFNSGYGMDAYECSSCGHAHYIDLDFKQHIVDYLQRSNTVALEPDLERRLLIDRRLMEARKVLEGQIDALDEKYPLYRESRIEMYRASKRLQEGNTAMGA